jgi:tape measure domain-containing protein
MSEKVGGIYYEIDAEYSRLVNGGKHVDEVLGKMNSSFAKTDNAAKATQFQMTQTAQAVQELGRQAQAAQNPLSGLGKLLGGLLTIQGVNGLIQMAEGYNEMAERITMATRSSEEYDHVQQRLLKTANGTYRNLSAAQEAFIKTSGSLRGLGYSLDQTIDITDSLSYSFVRNVTSADKAASIMNAYTLAINKGKVGAINWLTIVSGIPTIVDDIASATGQSAEAIREMGASGNITAHMLNEGLLQSMEANKKAADGMATTLRDAFRNFTNNLSAYIGEANRSTGTTRTMAAAIKMLGENIDTVVKLLMVAGAGALAKYVASTGAAVVKSVSAAMAARAQAAEELRLAQAHAATTAAALAHETANAALTGSSVAAARAAEAHAAAEVRLAAAQTAAKAAGVGLLRILGGPVGIIAMVASAAAGVFLFGSKSQEAAPKVDLLTASVNELGDANLRLMRTQLMDKINEMTALNSAAGVAGSRIEYLKRQLTQFPNHKGATEWRKEIEVLEAKTETESTALAQFKEQLAKVDKEMDRRSGKGPAAPKDPETEKQLNAQRQALELAKLDGEERVRAQAKIEAAQKLGVSATEKEIAEYVDLAVAIYRVNEAKKESHRGAGKADSATAYYQGLVAANETALAKINAEEEKALAENNARRKKDVANAAVYAAAEVQIKQKFATERAKLEEKNTQEVTAFNIEMMTDSEAKSQAIRDESVRKAKAALALKVIDAAEAARQIALAEKKYADESAARQEQVAQAAADNRIAKTQSEVTRLNMIHAEAYRRIDEQERTGVITHDKALQDKIKADVDYENVRRDLLNKYDPAAAEQQRYTAQIDSLKQLHDLKLIEDQRYHDLAFAAEAEHQKNMLALQEESFKAQSLSNQLLMDSLNSLQQTGTSALTGMLEGTTSVADAMRSLAGSVLNEVVGALVKAGVEHVKNAVLAESTAATEVAATASVAEAKAAAQAAEQVEKTAAAAAYIASVAGQAASTTFLAGQAAFASTAAIPMVGPEMAPGAAAGAMAAAGSLGSAAVTAASATMAGGRQYGGPVDANKMYRINETGQPEILNTLSGQQFLLPNTRGQVVSNKDATAGTVMTAAGPMSVDIVVNVSVAPSGGGQVDSKASGSGQSAMMNQLGKMIGNTVKEHIGNEMRPGGMLWAAKNGRA